MAEPLRFGRTAFVAAADLRHQVESALDDDRTGHGSDGWAVVVRTLDAAITALVYARDGATVLAHQQGMSWPALETSSGIPRSTLHTRAARFSDREIDR